jgi:acetylornithine deacetylase/succinyl-diaminopimelate desuccinylase-like protein
MLILAPVTARAQEPPAAVKAEAREILRELIEINTAWKEGSTTPAARAVAQRFIAAGVPASEVTVVGPAGDKDSSVVVRFTGTSSAKPILLIAHLDVVEALPSDWSLDPFKLTEKDGFFYGRGTSDIKGSATTLVEALLRMKREGFTPKRTLILALTAGEEGGGGYNGMTWLIENRRPLIDAAFALNVDSGDPLIKNGKRMLRPLQTSEKFYQNFLVDITNKGGHSSLPTPDNAIARVSAAIGRIASYQFPVHLTETTTAYFAGSAQFESGQTAVDMQAIARNPRDSAAASRLSASPFYNAQLRTTCVPTMIQGGHAPNALPQHVRVNVNCRILPGETVQATLATLIRVAADDSVRIPAEGGGGGKDGGVVTPPAASPLSDAVLTPLRDVTRRLWGNVPVIPQMETGATDGSPLRGAGIPTYGISGIFIDMDDIRAHGRDERIMVKSFYEGVEYIYQLLREFAASG